MTAKSVWKELLKQRYKQKNLKTLLLELKSFVLIVGGEDDLWSLI